MTFYQGFEQQLLNVYIHGQYIDKNPYLQEVYFQIIS